MTRSERIRTAVVVAVVWVAGLAVMVAAYLIGAQPHLAGM